LSFPLELTKPWFEDTPPFSGRRFYLFIWGIFFLPSAPLSMLSVSIDCLFLRFSSSCAILSGLDDIYSPPGSGSLFAFSLDLPSEAEIDRASKDPIFFSWRFPMPRELRLVAFFWCLGSPYLALIAGEASGGKILFPFFLPFVAVKIRKRVASSF